MSRNVRPLAICVSDEHAGTYCRRGDISGCERWDDYVREQIARVQTHCYGTVARAEFDGAGLAPIPEQRPSCADYQGSE